MKNLKQIIQEKLIINKNSKVKQQVYNYHPKTRDELKELVDKLIGERGNDADLNDIDTSAITVMSGLFHTSNFKGDISNWDVSNVQYMDNMFFGCKEFNGNICHWNVSNVTSMNGMFASCSKFNCDISNWDVSNVTDMGGLFCRCNSFNQDISKWKVDQVKNMINLFRECSKFDQDISKWRVSRDCEKDDIFLKCPLQKHPPKWYKK